MATACIRLQMVAQLRPLWATTYEVNGTTVTKCYVVYPAGGGAGAQRIAMRTGDDVYYLLADQLGSTSKTVYAATGATTKLRYVAWGGLRRRGSGGRCRADCGPSHLRTGCLAEGDVMGCHESVRMVGHRTDSLDQR
jgi:hypothetical protein